MKGFTVGFDRYERKARITPALIAIAPVAIALFARFGREDFGLPALADIGVSALVCTVALAFLAQLARSLGRAKEPQLFARWGGKPSISIFRHRDREASAVTKSRYHTWLKSELHLPTFPSAADEARDPASADDVYAACVDFLKNNTRDKKRFFFVSEENSNYGFHRNLWALKPLGITTSAAGTIACSLLVRNYWASDAKIHGVALVGAIISLAILTAWIVVITPGWVHEPAKAYANALFNACESLRTHIPDTGVQSEAK